MTNHQRGGGIQKAYHPRHPLHIFKQREIIGYHTVRQHISRYFFIIYILTYQLKM